MPVKMFLQHYRWMMREAVAIRRLEERRGKPLPLADEAERWRACFDGLLTLLSDVKARTVIRLFYGCGDTDEAIAAALDLSDRHVKRIRAAALASLQEKRPIVDEAE